MDNRYCVYLHRRKLDNKPFYIGSGVQGQRDLSKDGRSKAWHSFISGGEFISEVLHPCLTKTESLLKEQEELLHSTYELVNIHKPIIHFDLDLKLINEYLKYDPSSKTYLTWLKTAANCSKVGGCAGSITTSKSGIKESGTVNLLGKKLKIHRIIWVMFGNKIEENYVIDHIDNNPHNNSIDNLRCVSQAVNARNKVIPKKHDLPYGINIRGGKYPAYSTSVTFNGERKCKHFSIKKYGNDKALAMAKEFRLTGILELNLLGAEYSNNHID